MPTQKTLSFILLLSLGFIWGTGYSIARFAMTHAVPPLGYSFWQSLGPACLLSLFTLIKNKSIIKFDLPHLKYYLICGLTGIVIPNTNMYFAAPHLPAGLLAVVVNTVPIIAYPLALLLRVEKFHLSRLMAVCLAVAGLMLLVLPKMSLPSPQMSHWVFLVLLTPLSFAFCAVFIARYRPHDSDSLSLSAGMLIFSSLMLLPLVIGDHSFYPLNFPLTIPDLVIILEIILSSAGYFLFFQLIKIAGPVYYSMVDTIVSLTGLMWGYVIFQERLNVFSGMSVLLIILSLVLINRHGRS